MNPFEVHSYAPGDAERASAALTAWAEVDETLVASPLEEWTSFVAQSFNRDGRDFALALEEGEVRGLLMSTLLEESGRMLRNFRIIVDPANRGRGAATQLFELVEGQDEAPFPAMQSSCRRVWEVGTGFLERRGFRAVRDVLWMGLDLPDREVTSVAKIAIRRDRGDAEDDAAWVRLTDDGYAGGPDYHKLTEEDLALMRRESGHDLWFAEDRGEVIGLCHAKAFGGKPVINSLVVLSSHRSRGIGRALLARGLAALAERGNERASLTVLADNEPAVSLYRSAGFEDEDVVTTWWKERE